MQPRFYFPCLPLILRYITFTNTHTHTRKRTPEQAADTHESVPHEYTYTVAHKDGEQRIGI